MNVEKIRALRAETGCSLRVAQIAVRGGISVADAAAVVAACSGAWAQERQARAALEAARAEAFAQTAQALKRRGYGLRDAVAIARCLRE